MKKIFKALSSVVTLAILALTLQSCNEEFSSIDSDVLNEDNFNFNTDQFEIPIKTYNQNLSGQQIDGLPSNLIGYYNDPVYGATSASIIAQLLPNSFETNANTFGTDPVVESVKLTIPYFSTEISVDDNGKPEYRIDSLYTQNNDITNVKSIKLTIYQNNYFLRNFDVNGESNQNYYSKADASINDTDNFSEIETEVINFDEHTGFLIYDNENFQISNEPREIITTTDGVETPPFLPPAMEIDFPETDENKNFWKNLILDQEGLPTLTNANNFLNHFRGLYIKAQAVSNDGSMVLLNLADSGANVVINYSIEDGIDADSERDTGSYTLNFSGIRLNTFINNYNSLLPSTPDTNTGDAALFLKGTEGSMAVIELFDGLVDCDGDGQINDDALECFKKTFRKTDDTGEFIIENNQFELKRLVNEANLVIYEEDTFIPPDQPEVFNAHTYDRLYIYDLENNIPTADYINDFSADADNPLNSRRFSLGARIVDDEGQAKYKIKITDLLNNILIRDTDNTKLGLVLSNNVNINLNNELLNSNSNVTGTPATTVITPRGSVLYGNNTDATTPEGNSKRLRLEVFFTESR